MKFNSFSSSLSALGMGALLTASSALVLSSDYPYYSKLVEVYFYDKNSKTERIKVWIEDLTNLSKVQFLKTSSSTPTLLLTQSSSQESSETWEWLSYETESEKVTKYKNLADIARYFLSVQHRINLIKSLEWSSKLKTSSGTDGSEALKTELQNCCKNDKKCKDCCCKETGKTCKDCTSCVCCYLKKKDDSTQDCCCKNGDCDTDEFLKDQKRFYYTLNNFSAAQANTYLTPLQAHIKLSDFDIDNDFKSGSTSTNGTSSSSPTYKKILGTLVYGFVDYNYQTKSHNDIKDFYKNISSDGDLSTLSSSKGAVDKQTIYFGNVPQSYYVNFDSKEKAVKEYTDLSSSNGSSKKNDLAKLWKELENKDSVLKEANISSLTSIRTAADKYPHLIGPARPYKPLYTSLPIVKVRKKRSAPETDCCLCCPPEDVDLKCLIKRNYVFKRDKLDDYKNSINKSTVTASS